MTLTRLLRPARALQQPQWCSLDRLNDALEEIESRPALVGASEVHDLRRELEFAARGGSFMIQAGDCAERFGDATPARTRRKADFLHSLANLFTSRTGVPVITVGRMAGQYAKPRSTPTELRQDGLAVPVYRGDAVNSLAADPDARVPDPDRLVMAYRCAETVLRNLPPPPSRQLTSPVYVSHEALLLEYEQSLVRPCGDGEYGSSGHMLWVGERTRQIDHAHIGLLASIENPVGVKLGPGVSGQEARELIRVLNPGGEPGRLTFIVRMGTAQIAARLPELVDALGDAAGGVVWMCDPMHGNTTATAAGQKTRMVEAVLKEVTTFFGVLAARGLPVGGLHLECTPDPVYECVADTSELEKEHPLPRYETACDPRLNEAQARAVVAHAAGLMA